MQKGTKNNYPARAGVKEPYNPPPKTWVCDKFETHPLQRGTFPLQNFPLKTQRLLNNMTLQRRAVLSPSGGLPDLTKLRRGWTAEALYYSALGGGQSIFKSHNRSHV